MLKVEYGVHLRLDSTGFEFLTSNGSYGFTFNLMVQIMCGPTFHNVEDSQSTAVSTKTVSSRISGYLNEFL